MIPHSLISNNIVPLATIVSLAISVCPGLALDNITQQSSTVETTTTNGDPTIIQHIDSKMEPTVVQSRSSTDPQTGEKEKIVEPIIMERREKVLDTTIIQPQINEVRKTTEQVQQTREALPKPAAFAPVRKPIAAKPHRHRFVSHRPVRAHIAYHQSPHRAASSSVSHVVQTTEVTRESGFKETVIQAPPNANPPEAPQVIHKVEQ
jgi:hypothetical protein